MLAKVNCKSLLASQSTLFNAVRNASKKTGGSTKNPTDPHNLPKHRGWKRQDGSWVTKGTLLALQTSLRFFPGVNVGFGNNFTLFARCSGKVYVTCEKTDMNMDHRCVKHFFAGREGQTIYKKYFNVVPIEQHQRFKLIDEI